MASFRFSALCLMESESLVNSDVDSVDVLDDVVVVQLD